MAVPARRNGSCVGGRMADHRFPLLPGDTRVPWIVTTVALLLIVLACAGSAG